MKADALMIGDWVYDTILKCNTQVEMLSLSGIRGDCHDNIWNENTFKPIPLTPEILEKNGFDKRWHDRSKCIIFDPRNDNVVSICYNYYNATISIEDMPFVKVNKHNKSYQKIENIGCQYVHELQHALKLCGIEKEIEL